MFSLQKTSRRRLTFSALRMPDIFVPPEQVIDTVDLYYLENRQRRLSLRFLTWFVLKENIQTDTHDSIEDSLSALKLYKVHLQLEAGGTFDNKLDEVYREGRQYVSRPLALCCTWHRHTDLFDAPIVELQATRAPKCYHYPADSFAPAAIWDSVTNASYSHGPWWIPAPATV